MEMLLQRGFIIPLNQRRNGSPTARQRLARTLAITEYKINSGNFVIMSRRHLVNRKFIVEVCRDFVILSNNTVLLVSGPEAGGFLIG